MGKEDKVRELEQIIKGKQLRTHFQPIISLKTGKILGYEALTRGPEDNLYQSPNQLFADAKCFNMLFINVDPCVLCDKKFCRGFYPGFDQQD